MSEDNSGINENIAVLKMKIQEAKEEIKLLEEEEIVFKDADQLQEFEQRARAAANKLVGLLSGLKVQESLGSDELKEEGLKLAKSHPKKMRNQGNREIEIIFSGGESVKIKSAYYSAKKPNRRKPITGFYPGQVLLGIYQGCSPEFSSEISEMAVLANSLQEASKALIGRGIELSAEAVRAIAYRTAERAKLVNKSESFKFEESLKGKKVIVSTDGGRIRIRKDKRGKKTTKGRNRYSTSWREPKLLIIYVAKEKGEMDRTIAPFIDGTLRGPDAVFRLLRYYLSKLEISKADKIVFVADAAPWIWKRFPKLAKELGLSKEQVFEVIDFYHAVEHLGHVAALRKGWTATERKRWVKHQRKMLLTGKVSEVINAIEQLCNGRSGKAIRRERDFFIKHAHRMNYANVVALELPIGSGAMESAIRRVVNLRLKGPAIFWHRENAEAMLMLRSYYKAGRWNLLERMAFAPSIPMAA
jgi:RNase P/RNase MRP subunit p29